VALNNSNPTFFGFYTPYDWHLKAKRLLGSSVLILILRLLFNSINLLFFFGSVFWSVLSSLWSTATIQQCGQQFTLQFKLALETQIMCFCSHLALVDDPSQMTNVFVTVIYGIYIFVSIFYVAALIISWILLRI